MVPTGSLLLRPLPLLLILALYIASSTDTEHEEGENKDCVFCSRKESNLGYLQKSEYIEQHRNSFNHLRYTAFYF